MKHGTPLDKLADKEHGISYICFHQSYSREQREKTNREIKNLRKSQFSQMNMKAFDE